MAFIFSFSVQSQEKLTVFFDFDQSAINADALQKLNNWITENKNVEVTKIYGFCDWKGTNSYNDSLSIKRVRTVFEFLRQNGITIREGYEIRGFGKDFDQSKVQSENRKVTVAYEIIKPKKTTDKDAKLALGEKLKTAKAGEKIKLQNLYFFNMPPRVLEKSKPVMFDLLCAMQDNPKLKIEIQGHICCQLSGDINNLSVSRAKAVYNFLISNGINRHRLSMKGFGVSSPVYPIPEKNEEEQEANRRVEIQILEI